MTDTILSITIILITFFLVNFLDKEGTQWVKKITRWIPAILFSFIFPAIITHVFKLDLSSAPIFSWNTKYLYPVTIFTIMASMSLKQLKIVGFKPLFLFFFGSLIISITPILLLLGVVLFQFDISILLIENGYWKGLIPIVGSWIGGSSSMLILKEYIALNEDLFFSVLVIDTIIQNIVMVLLFQSIKQTKRIDEKYDLDLIKFTNVDLEKKSETLNLPLTLFFSFSIPILFIFINLSFLTNVILLSILGLLFGNFLKFWSHAINLKLGSIGIILIMAIIGLKLNFESFELPLEFVGIISAWMLINLISITIIGFKLKISFSWTPIIIMANIGGISTAPALASAYDKRLMPHAIVLAILSMATGTFWGIITVAGIRYFIL